MLESAWPYTCEMCPSSFAAVVGCHGVSEEPIILEVGGKSCHRDIILDRCPLAIIRDVTPEIDYYSAEAIRWAVALERGSLDMGPERWTAAGLDVIYLAHDIMLQSQGERAAAEADRRR